MSDFNIVIGDQPDSEEAGQIRENLLAFNIRAAGESGFKALTVTMKEKDRVVAGLDGHTAWGWLFIQRIWISDEKRAMGLGSKLLSLAEETAKTRECHHAWVDTFSFQAPLFYEKNGYEKFATLDEYPFGHQRFFYKKNL